MQENGEIFTPPKLVEEMLDKIPLQIWKDPSKTVCDPSAGNGNFLVTAFNRKIKYGSTPTQALSTIYGVELMLDNTLECRERLLELAGDTEDHRRIVERNIVNADALQYNHGDILLVKATSLIQVPRLR